jgi:hypothetical protein
MQSLSAFFCPSIILPVDDAAIAGLSELELTDLIIATVEEHSETISDAEQKLENIHELLNAGLQRLPVVVATPAKGLPKAGCRAKIVAGCRRRQNRGGLPSVVAMPAKGVANRGGLPSVVATPAKGVAKSKAWHRWKVARGVAPPGKKAKSKGWSAVRRPLEMFQEHSQ